MKKTHILLALLAVLLSLGCEQIIPIDLPEQDPQLVVSCTITPDSVWRAYVNRSVSIQDGNGPQPFGGATVYIQENGQNVDTLVHRADGYYYTDSGRRPQAGHTYTIQASAPGLATVSGTDFVPFPVAPENIQWRDSTSYNQAYYGEISLDIDDPAGTENFYMLSVLSLDSAVDGDTTYYYLWPVDLLIQDPIMEYNGFNGTVMFDDLTFDGTRRRLKVQMDSYQHANTGGLILVLSTVTRNYYRYAQTMEAYLETSFNPFAEPVRIHSNMTPGMGIFAGYSMSYDLVP